MTAGVHIDNQATPALKRIDEGMTSALAVGMLSAAQRLGGHVRKTVMATLNKDPTGALARSYKATLLSQVSGKVVSGVFSDLPYARIQDEGGTIRAKKRYLTIPLIRMPRGKRARDFNLVFLISKRGNPLLVDAKALSKKRPQVKPIFALKKSVRLEGEDYLRKASIAALPDITEEVGDAIHVHVEKSTKGR